MIFQVTIVCLVLMQALLCVPLRPQQPEGGTPAATLPDFTLVSIVSRSGQPYRLEVTKTKQISMKASLVNLTEYAEVAQDIELTADQERELDAVKKSIGRLNQELLSRLDSADQESIEVTRAWAREQVAAIDRQIDGVLLDQQMGYLNAIRTAYLAGTLGYAQAFSAPNSGLEWQLSEQSIFEISRAERDAAAELRSQHEALLQKWLNSIANVLTDEQRSKLDRVFDPSDVLVPELFVAQARLLQGKPEIDIPQDPLRGWGGLATWKLGYDGQFQLEYTYSREYDLDQLLANLVNEGFASVDLEVLPYQRDELLEVQAQVRQLNQQIGMAHQAGQTRAVGQLVQSKRQMILNKLDGILLPTQQDLLHALGRRISVRQTGLLHQFDRGDLRTWLNLTASQVDDIRGLGKRVESEWRQYSMRDISRIQGAILQAIEDDRDRQLVQRFFEENRRVAKLPVGIFCLSQARQ